MVWSDQDPTLLRQRTVQRHWGAQRGSSGIFPSGAQTAAGIAAPAAAAVPDPASGPPQAQQLPWRPASSPRSASKCDPSG